VNFEFRSKQKISAVNNSVTLFFSMFEAIDNGSSIDASCGVNGASPSEIGFKDIEKTLYSFSGNEKDLSFKKGCKYYIICSDDVSQDVGNACNFIPVNEYKDKRFLIEKQFPMEIGAFTPAHNDGNVFSIPVLTAPFNLLDTDLSKNKKDVYVIFMLRYSFDTNNYEVKMIRATLS